MDLREEYKKSMESASPDREAMDRMKAAVLAKIAAGEGEPGIPEAKKKPLPLRRIACIGGAAAACAVIAVSAATILPNMENATGMVSKSESSMAAGEIAGSCDISGADFSGNAEICDTDPGITASGTKDNWFFEEDDIVNMTEDVADGIAPDSITDTTPENSWSADTTGNMPDNGGTANSLPPDRDEPDKADEPEDADDKLADSAATAEIADAADSGNSKGDSGNFWGAVTVEPAYTGEVPTADQSVDESTHNPEAGFDETAECDETLEMCETVEMTEEGPDPEERMTTIVFSGGDWVSYAGERYTLCKRKPPAGAAVTAVDPVSGTYYDVVQDGGTIAVYNGGKLVGVYKK